MVSFNYGKWGSEIMYGAIISFWLLTHLINLTFSLYIARRRQINRQSERFARSVKGSVQVNEGTNIPMTTIDISDKGLLFRQADSAGLESGREVFVELYHAGKTITFNGVIRIKYDDNTKYGLQITILLQIIKTSYIILLTMVEIRYYTGNKIHG